MYKLALVLHLVGASVWLGGHLILALRIAPKALKLREPSLITDFEREYEPLGLPALLLQIVTGLWLAFGHYKVSLLDFSSYASRGVHEKLLLLLVTLALAVHARFFLIPNLSENTIKSMSYHIWAISGVAVLMLLAGILHFR
jgi:putative copper export protein